METFIFFLILLGLCTLLYSESKKGVYLISDEKGAKYAGESKNMHKRLEQHAHKKIIHTATGKYFFRYNKGKDDVQLFRMPFSTKEARLKKEAARHSKI